MHNRQRQKNCWKVLGICLLLGLQAHTVASAEDSRDVVFVTQVPKSCEHLGSLTVDIDSEDFFSENMGVYHSLPAGPWFSSKMKQQARSLGASHLVIADIFHDKTIRGGTRMVPSQTITATSIRARAFRCSRA